MASFSIEVELWIDGAWVDVTNHVRDQPRIVIDRVGTGEHGRLPNLVTTRCMFSLDNRDNRFSNNVPGALYYRKLGTNTQVRVAVDSDLRFTGEIPAMYPQADSTGRDAVVVVEAAGMIRRLSAGQKPLRSVAYRGIMAPSNDADRVAYWPVEEESGATRISSPAGSPTPTVFGDVTFGAYTASPSSERMLTFGADGRVAFPVPDYTATEHKVIFLWHTPADGLPNGTTICRLHTVGGTITAWDLLYTEVAAGTLEIRAYAGNPLADTFGPYAYAIDGEDCLITIELLESGGDTEVTVLVGKTDDGATGVATETFVGQLVGQITMIEIAQYPADGASFGHLAVCTNVDGFANFISQTSAGSLGWRGYTGETPVERMQRLCDEEGVAFTTIGAVEDGQICGPQDTDKLLALLVTAVSVGQGILYEPRNMLGLEYRTRAGLYNQAPTLELDYAAGHLSAQLVPAADDLDAANDVTISRPDGSSARHVIPDNDFWHLTTQDPANWFNGIGPYNVDLTMQVESDDQLDQQAAWVAHLRSWAEPRYPAVGVNLAKPIFDGDAVLSAAAAAVDLGDMIAIASQPAWVPPDPLEMLVIGYRERVDKRLRQIDWVTVPYRPWEVRQVDTAGSTLAWAVDDNDTTLKIATSLGPAWSTTDEPYHIQIAGEAMTVTAIATETITYVAAGAVDHDSNASVTPGLPAGVVNGDVLVLVAAIRNSGTGTPDRPSGWEFLSASTNLQVFGRYSDGTAADTPTVTFSGGAANATTSAQMIALRGCSLELGGGTKATPAIGSNVTGSAQNIVHPALTVVRDNCAVLLAAWKQDDWTGAAPPTGWTEAFDSSSALGDDQAIWLGYQIQTTATNIAVDTIVVTGGASAISRSRTIALRPLQTATVTRSVNGVTGSIAAGEAVHGWRMGVNAL